MGRFYSTSAKQYLLTKRIDNLTLPNQRSNDEDILADCMIVSKAKGLQKRRQDEVLSVQSYRDTIDNNESTKLDIYNFKKYMFDIFITKTRRSILSKGTSKRIFLEDMRQNESHWSLPLFLKKIEEEDETM